ncbi:MAG: galactokinase [Acidobacteriales bacterium]|nr:galactokinase [Terriglobales bacterium]
MLHSSNLNFASNCDPLNTNAVVRSLKAEFSRHFAGEPSFFRAPGRVNLIGEHTDYNEGYVLPAAIDFDVRIACAKDDGSKLRVYSVQQTEDAELDLAESDPHPRHDWTDYIRGVELQLRKGGTSVRGANLVIDGRVPMGAGLSSSAALEVSVSKGLMELSGQSMNGVEMARLCQRAENEFVGARCGIMDQFSSIFGRAGHAMLLDCRSLELEYVPLPNSVCVVICNTMVRHSLSSGEYNKRRAQCEEGVRYFAARRDGVTALRDVSESLLTQHGDSLPDVLFRRCRHVVTENARVLRAANALKAGDLATLGKLMYESHTSLKDDYEVSCQELDIMVHLASETPGTWGSRMTGGGFGGCTISIVSRDSVAEFKSRMSREYKSATSIDPEIYVTSAAEGAGILT